MHFLRTGALRALLTIALLASLLSTMAGAAPVVVTPGEASSYVFFPAGVTAAGGTADTSEFVGMIAVFPVQPPNGWLVCDGSTVQSADYPALVKLLTGNQSATSTTLPDYRGYFLRGWDSMGEHGAAGVDAGRSLGIIQNDENKGHAHTGTAASGGSHNHVAYGTLGGYHGPPAQVDDPFSNTNGWPRIDSATSSAGAHTHALTINNSGGVESRPKNISVIYAIRAKRQATAASTGCWSRKFVFA